VLHKPKTYRISGEFQDVETSTPDFELQRYGGYNGIKSFLTTKLQKCKNSLHKPSKWSVLSRILGSKALAPPDEAI